MRVIVIVSTSSLIIFLDRFSFINEKVKCDDDTILNFHIKIRKIIISLTQPGAL
jgi:hypothetical protein